MALMMDVAALQRFLGEAFPQVAEDFTVLSSDETGLAMQLNAQDRHLRPGGTVSGPTMFGLVDVAMYLAILARIGPVALAVTTNCSIDFMRKPAAGASLIAVARVLKLGRSLAVGDVMVHAGPGGPVVARASLTYSIPPESVG